MNIAGIIPSRYDSSRFPGKPLAMIEGKSMIQRVYEQAGKCKLLSSVIIATDNQVIYNHVTDFGGKVVMTSEKHRSGTERCHEALIKEEKKGNAFDVVVNIQGDEPYIDPVQIKQVADLFLKKQVQIGTLLKTITDKTQRNDPNIVKAIKNKNNEALYFSRAAIPFLREKNLEASNSETAFYKHIGIYGYRTSVLKQLVKLPYGMLEQAEALEQLRWLEHGFKIHVDLTETDTQGIDTYDDIVRITQKQNNKPQ
ncbi:MAG: 3-deoxy-manno-octulosonate cytidylyltransferase [Bacteroidota bacterium]